MKLESLNDKIKLLSANTDSFLTVAEDEKTLEIKIAANSLTRNALLIAFLDKENVWRLRFMVMTTPIHGVLVFKLFTTLRYVDGKYIIPEKYRTNSIGLIGIAITKEAETVNVICQVYAGEFQDGRKINDSYTGSFGWTAEDKTGVSPSLDGAARDRNKRLFSDCFQRPKSTPIGTFRDRTNENAYFVR